MGRNRWYVGPLPRWNEPLQRGSVPEYPSMLELGRVLFSGTPLRWGTGPLLRLMGKQRAGRGPPSRVHYRRRQREQPIGGTRTMDRRNFPTLAAAKIGIL